MEIFGHRNQVIQEYDGDHVEKGDRYNIMTMSVESREIWLPSRSCDSLCERPSSPSSQQSSLETFRTSRADKPLRRRRRSASGLGYLLFFIASLWVIPASAVLVDFQNCLSEGYQNDTPLQLQFDPLYLNAVFNTSASSHNLNITVWGNVTGSGPGNGKETVLPAWNDKYWTSNETNLGGKIQDLPDPPPGVNKYTTLFNKINVLTYEPWSSTVNFCDQLINASCPLAPSFANA